MEIKYNLERVKKVRFRHKVEWSIAQWFIISIIIYSEAN